jgi:hypothetical protein
LLLLGAAFGTMPIELRYLAFAAPFVAALLAGAAQSWARRLPRTAPAAFAVLLVVQAAGTAGMALHPATRQAYRDALAALAPSLGPEALLLVPEGNDGVGIVGAVLAEAARDQPMLVLRLEEIPLLHDRAAPYARPVLLGINDRVGNVQAAAARAALAADPRWVELSRPWRDARRGFEASVFSARPADARGSGMADRAEGVVIGGTHHGSEKP